MKMTKSLFFILMGLAAPVFGEIDQGDALNDACCYEFLSSENLEEFQSWDNSNEVHIGFDENQNEKSSLIGKRSSMVKEWTNHLVNITFENEEVMPKQQKLIADNQSEMKSIGAAREMD